MNTEKETKKPKQKKKLVAWMWSIATGVVFVAKTCFLSPGALPQAPFSVKSIRNKKSTLTQLNKNKKSQTLKQTSIS